tara:strand:+ start:1644 stop:3788 length:2145 start_codon:yes stop_codon:yes gene_type:complete
MATTLNIGGKKVKVDDSFNDLDAAGQQKVIRRIERDLGISSRDPAKASKKGTTLTDVARFGLGQGLALGFGDEIEAGLKSAFTDESYGDAVDRIRGEMDAYRKDNAGKALAMELGGGLLTGGVGAGRAAAGAAARGAMGAIKSGALAGSGIGGVAGFGSGRDTLESRLTNAAIGAGAGGLLGGGLPAAGGAIRSGVNRLRAATDTLSDAGVQRTADLKMLQKLQQEGMTPTQALARLKQAQRDGVSDTMIADVGGESVRGLAQGATAVSGKARTLAEEALDTRQAKSGFEIADDVMGNLASGKSATQATEEIINRQASNAAGDYRRAFMDLDQPRIVDSGFGDLVNSAGFKRAYLEARKLASYDDVTLPKFEDFAASASNKSRSDLEMQLSRLMAQNDITQRGLRTHREMLKTQSAETMRDVSPSPALTKAAKLADELDALPKLTFQQAHYIKMGMDAAIDTGKRRGSLSNVEQGKLTGLRQTFKDRLFDENPAYKEANARFAGDAALRDAIDVGKKIFSGTADDLKPIVKNMSESEREAFRIGVAQAIRDRVSNQRDLANSAQDLFGKDRFRGLLREAFPDAKSFADFEKRMTARINQEVTRGRTKPSGGSRTAFAQEDAKDVVRDAELFTNLLSGNIGGVGRDLVTRGGGLGAKVGTRVAGDLFDTNLGNQREILRRLSQLRRGEAQRLRQSAQRGARIGGRSGAVSGLLTD